MANFAPLITAWNSATQPPTGATGTAIVSGMTRDQKVAAVNSWTVAVAAKPMVIPTYEIYNAIVPAEFQALSAANQQLIRDILGMGTVDVSAGTGVRNVILQVFGAATVTRANLTLIAAPYDTPRTPWWQANGFQSPICLGDAIAAGLS